jgi:hypothetical protein
MDLRTIVRFQLGFSDAVESVARNRASFLTGIILVLLTGIARNYDQDYFPETPLALFGPLIFSFFSGTFLFLVLYYGFIRLNLEGEDNKTWTQWFRFMSLFWMTAPVAWWYAIPVERFFNSYQAAVANLILLGIVSVWRVLLMARIVSVLLQVHFGRAFAWVLTAASLEVVVLSFFGGLSHGIDRSIAAGMAGMRNSPEQDLLLHVLEKTFLGALALFAVLLVGSFAFRYCDTLVPLPPQMPGRVPIKQVVALAVIWIGISIPSQIKQQRFVTHARLVGETRYRDSIEYLVRHAPGDFPASRRLEPDPFEFRSFEQLPGVVAELRPDDPEWVRQLYLSHLSAFFNHRHFYGPGDSPAAFARMFGALEKLPERQQWIEANRERLPILMPLLDAYGDPQARSGVNQLGDTLIRIGVDLASITNAHPPHGR